MVAGEAEGEEEMEICWLAPQIATKAKVGQGKGRGLSLHPGFLHVCRGPRT